MKFILLGSGPGLPNRINHLSCLYVNSGGKNLLFDCGEGASRQLLKHGLEGDVLDAIFISHFHPDHVSGLFMLLQMLLLQKRQKPLQLFLPERPAVIVDILSFLYTFPQNFTFQLQILDCAETELYYGHVTPAATDHLRNYAEFLKNSQHANQMSSYAFKVSSGNGDLVYTSDINTTDCLMPFISNCNTVIVDALHPDSAQILKLQFAGIKRIILTHGISEELNQSLSKDPIENYEIAEEDRSYTLN